MIRRFLPLAALVALAGCGADDTGAEGDPGAALLVKVSAAIREPVLISAPAMVRSERTAELATRASGTIRSIGVDVGERVQEGQILAQLDAQDVRARVAMAEANLELARRYHSRIEALEVDGAATGQELDEATAQLRVAEAGVREARGGLTYASLRAPFAGVVTARYADPGDLATPGRPLLELAGSGDLVVEADLPAHVSVWSGQEVLVEQVSPSTGEWRAEITRVVPVLDRSSRRFRVEGRFMEAGQALPTPNSVVSMTMASESDSVVVVPSDAIITRGQLAGVFIAQDSALRLRWIRLGRERKASVEVLAGLSEGDLVVREPDESLVDGQLAGGIESIPWRPEAGAQ